MLEFHKHPHYKAHFERNVFDSFLMLRKTESGFPQKKKRKQAALSSQDYPSP